MCMCMWICVFYEFIYYYVLQYVSPFFRYQFHGSEGSQPSYENGIDEKNKNWKSVYPL